MDVGKLREYIDLTLRKRKLEDEIREIKDQLEPLEKAVTDIFIEEGMQKITLGDYTVHIIKNVYPKLPQGRDAAVAVLKNSPEFGSLVSENFNNQTLAKTIREILAENEELPAEWTGIIETSDVHRVGVTTGGK